MYIWGIKSGVHQENIYVLQSKCLVIWLTDIVVICFYDQKPLLYIQKYFSDLENPEVLYSKQTLQSVRGGF